MALRLTASYLAALKVLKPWIVVDRRLPGYPFPFQLSHWDAQIAAEKSEYAKPGRKCNAFSTRCPHKNPRRDLRPSDQEGCIALQEK